MRMAFLRMIQKLEAKKRKQPSISISTWKKKSLPSQKSKDKQGKKNSLAIHVVDRGLHSANRGEKRTKQKLGTLYDLTFHRK